MSQQQNGANAVAAHAERHAERHSERQAAKNARDRMKESNEWFAILIKDRSLILLPLLSKIQHTLLQ